MISFCMWSSLVTLKVLQIFSLALLLSQLELHLRRSIHTFYLFLLSSVIRYRCINSRRQISFPSKLYLFGWPTYHFLNPSENRYNSINVSVTRQVWIVGPERLELPMRDAIDLQSTPMPSPVTNPFALFNWHNAKPNLPPFSWLISTDILVMLIQKTHDSSYFQSSSTLKEILYWTSDNLLSYKIVNLRFPFLP